MSNSINLITLGQFIQGLSDNQDIQLPKLPPQLMEFIKIGDFAKLEITLTDTGILLGSLKTDDKVFNLQLNNISLPLTQGEAVVIPVRVSAGGQLVLQKNILPNEHTSNTDFIMSSPKSAPIELSPLKISKFIDNYLQSLNVDEGARQDIIQDISSLKTTIDNVLRNEIIDNENVLKPLCDILIQIADNPSLTKELKPLLLRSISDLVGKRIAGEVINHINDITIVKTPLGEVFFSSKIKLPLHETLNVNIISEVVQNDIKYDMKFLDNFIKIITTSKNTDISPEQIIKIPELKLLSEILTPMSSDFTKLVLGKLIIQPNNLFKSIYNLHQISKKADIQDLLGSDIINKITQENKDSAKMIQNLQMYLNSSIKDTPNWKIVDMPLFDGSQFFPLKLAVKKDSDKSPKNITKQKSGSRFIVETEFSKLGRFQFDGFANATKRNFDLIIRTSKCVDDDFFFHIINLFKNSLYIMDYTGSIKINQEAEFINLQEQIKATKGFYV